MGRQPAKSPKLKVYRTPIGFHDAYVAAASQAAALRAWGADANLFARGVAEVVTDAKLTSAPLANPGAVIKVARGTAAEHIAALPKAVRRSAAKPTSATKPKPKPKPRPSRATLAAAETALAALDRRHAAERQALDERQRSERAKGATAHDRARDAYQDALAKWDG